MAEGDYAEPKVEGSGGPVAVKSSGDGGVITHRGQEVWFARFELLVKRSEYTNIRTWSSMSAHIDDSTINGYKHPRKTIDLGLMIAINRDFGYTIVDQLADLTGLPAEGFSASPKFEASPATDDRLPALTARWSRAPTVGDLTRAVLISCEHESKVGPNGESPFGRWRSRLFDIPMGWALPHVGYHGVEFIRWYGPNRGKFDDIYPSKLWWDKSADPQYTLERIKPIAAGFWFSDKKPANFSGTESEWVDYRYEHLELIARIGNNYAKARLSPYGAFGNISALLRHQDRSAHRHIFTQQASPEAPDPSFSALCADPSVRTIVVAGHGSLRPVPIASRIAEALGWEMVDFRTLEASVSGIRPYVGTHAKSNNSVQSWAKLSGVANHRDEMLVVSANFQYLLSGTGADAEFRPEVLSLLNDPTVAFVFLDADNDPKSDITSADFWADRRAATTTKGEEPLVDQKITASRFSRIIRDEAAMFQKVLVATVLPTFIHWGNAYVQPADRSPVDDDMHQFLWHPSIGDLDVRVAYELARLIVEGVPVGSDARRRGRIGSEASFRGFVPGSVIERHAARLLQITGGTYWKRSREAKGWLPPDGWSEAFSRPSVDSENMKRIHQMPSRTTRIAEDSTWLVSGLAER